MAFLSFIINFLFYLLFLSPFCLIIHEVGHAILYLLLLTRVGAG
jgi:hypothetical protein